MLKLCSGKAVLASTNHIEAALGFFFVFQKTAVWIAIVGAGLLLLAAIMNVIRVLEMREVDHTGGLLEPLRGGAQEELERKRDEDEVLLDREKYAADVEEGSSYKETVIHAEDLGR